MTYNINKTDGTEIFQIQDGTINEDTSVTLVGRNYSGWGEVLNENLIGLLENFAGSAEPNPAKLLTGQLWYDTTNAVLKIYNGTRFKPLAMSVSTSAPTNPSVGDLWWDSTTNQLKAWNGSSWSIVGPSATDSGAGKSGVFVESILDSLGNTHPVAILYVGGVKAVITSKDAEFTPASALSADLIGFSTIRPGVNVSSYMASGLARFVGTATNSDKITGLAFPSPTGNSGKYLTTTDGSTLSWATVAGGVSTLRNLTDVALDTIVSNNQILKYNTSTSKWINSDATTALTIFDESTSLTATPVSIKFTGTGVTATNSTNAITVTIPGTMGSGQTWQDLTLSRAVEVTYTNSTGAAIFVGIHVYRYNDEVSLAVDSVTVGSVGGVDGGSGELAAVVPNGSTYRVTGAVSKTGGNSIIKWAELRAT